MLSMFDNGAGAVGRSLKASNPKGQKAALSNKALAKAAKKKKRKPAKPSTGTSRPSRSAARFLKLTD